MNKIIFGFMLLLFTLTSNAQEKQSSETLVYKSEEVDTKAEFPGGVNAFAKFITHNLRLPEIKEGEKYKIYTSFIIEKDGSMSDVKVNNVVDEKMAAEVVKTLKSVKEKWTPAMKNGNSVRSTYFFPITINF